MVIALAGEKTAAFSAQLSECLGRLGLGRVVLQPDLLAMFHSGTYRLDGYGLIAGTGSIAARIRDGALHRVVGGRGWLLGDAGSGYWIGHQVARAVVSALDGQGQPTALTPLVLAALGIEGAASGRRCPNWCPRCMRAGRYSCRSSPRSRSPLPTIQSPEPSSTRPPRRFPTSGHRSRTTLTGPVVVGGSVVIRGFLAGPPDLRGRLGLPDDVVSVDDGAVGAAVLALREAGVVVDPPLFERVAGRTGC